LFALPKMDNEEPWRKRGQRLEILLRTRCQAIALCKNTCLVKGLRVGPFLRKKFSAFKKGQLNKMFKKWQKMILKNGSKLVVILKINHD